MHTSLGLLDLADDFTVEQRQDVGVAVHFLEDDASAELIRELLEEIPASTTATTTTTSTRLHHHGNIHNKQAV